MTDHKEISVSMGIAQRMNLVLSSLLLIAIVAIIWLAVSNNSSSATGQSSDSAVVATVNGEQITKDKLIDLAPAEFVEQVLEQAILELLINQELDKANLTISEADIDAAVDEQMEQIQKMFPTAEELEMALMSQGMTMESLLNEIRSGIQPDVKMKKLLAPQIDVSDENISTYYEENKDRILAALEIRASHILVASEELANSLLQQIRDGADFAQLATEHSIDPGSGAKGGDLGFFRRGAMVPEFEQAAYSLEVDEVSGVVASDFGYHIIKVTDKETELTLEDNKEEIKDMLFRQQFNELAPDWMRNIRETAIIERL